MSDERSDAEGSIAPAPRQLQIPSGREGQSAASALPEARPIAILSLGYVLIILTATFIAGRDIASFGQFGDSIAPITAALAALAAFAAVSSYRSQLDVANREKHRLAEDKFDSLFFRLTDHYDKLVDRCVLTRTIRQDDDSWLPQVAGYVLGRDNGDVTLTGTQVILDAVVIAQHNNQYRGTTANDLNGSGVPSLCETFYRYIGNYTLLNLQLAPVADTVVAIILTLEKQSRGVDIDPYGRIISAKISGYERVFWQIAISRMGTDSLAFCFACRLGLIDDEPRPFMGGYPYGIGNKRGLSKSTLIADIQRWQGDRSLVLP